MAPHPVNDSAASLNGDRTLRLVHHHPGRLRLRSEAFVDNDDTLPEVRAALEGKPGLIRVGHDARTGGLLIEYEPGLVEPDALMQRVAEALRLSPPPFGREVRRRPADLAWLVEATRRLDAATQEATGHRLELRAVVPLALIGVAITSFIAQSGQRLPRWDNLVFWSLSLGAQLYRNDFTRAAAAEKVAR